MKQNPASWGRMEETEGVGCLGVPPPDCDNSWGPVIPGKAGERGDISGTFAVRMVVGSSSLVHLFSLDWGNFMHNGRQSWEGGQPESPAIC